jgi:hypothetical protein
MLPNAYQLPAAVVMVLVGAVTCFAGYRLFRFLLAIWGFIIGAMIGSSMMGVGSAFAMIVAGLVGGVLGALVLVFAYFVGVALLGAGLSVLVTQGIWTQLTTGDPPALLVIFASIAGAVCAMVLQRYVIIVGTAIAGAWMTIVGVLAFGGAARSVGNGVWILYPLTPAPGQRWVLLALTIVTVIGTATQIGITGKR